MKKPFPCVVVISLMVAGFCVQTTAQQFQWPRERAFEIGGGASATGIGVHAGYVRFIQPKKPQEKPFRKRFKSLTARDRYEAFPCKRKTTNEIPPGLSFKTSLFYELGSGKGIRYQVIGMDASFLYAIYYNKYLFVSMKGGITGSNNRLTTPLQGAGRGENFSQFKYGVLGGIEVERMIDELQTTSFVLGWHLQYLDNKSNWGQKRWYAFVGVRLRIPKH